MKIKKYISISLCMLFTISAAGCGDSSEKSDETTTEITTETASEAVDETTDESVDKTADETTENTTAESDNDLNGFVNDYNLFDVTSENLHDGVWDDVISYDKGSNHSPELSWDPVDGASLYLVYMTDVDAGNWVHWMSNNVTDTKLPEGWAPETDYKGPYPPKGSTHTYEIYVVALKNPIERMKGSLDGQNPKFEENFKSVDTDADGNSGNMIAVGKLSGTFSE